MLKLPSFCIWSILSSEVKTFFCLVGLGGVVCLFLLFVLVFWFYTEPNKNVSSFRSHGLRDAFLMQVDDRKKYKCQDKNFPKSLCAFGFYVYVRTKRDIHESSFELVF